MTAFKCVDCGEEFTVSQTVRARYPNWTPKKCLDCRGTRPRPVSKGTALNPEEALAKFQGGPQTGIFTDGFCEPNPGLGGWGAVKVRDGHILQECHGGEEDTTNNRMELRALIVGYKMLDLNEALPVYSDSELCVNTITKWASAWRRKGWRKKGGEIKNLDLVRELFELAESHPNANLNWIRGHSGSRWNEYADALSRVSKEEQHA